VAAGTILIRFPHLDTSVSDIFMPISGAVEWGEMIWLWLYEYSYPCLTTECVTAKEAGTVDYDGVSEEDLINVKLIESKLPLQIAGGHMLEELQEKLLTEGIPVITEVKSVTVMASNTDNASATTVRAEVIVRVAAPFVEVVK
jgi:hypothetical protein